MYKFPYLVLFSLFFYSSFSQSLSKKDLRDLYSTIGIFVGDQEKLVGSGDRKNEFVFCFLEIDSVGEVNNVGLMLDDKNNDSTFVYLNRMTPTLFKNIKVKKCKNKTIMIPICSFSQSKTMPKYIEALVKFYKRTPVSIIDERNNFIITSLFIYDTPSVSI